MSAGALYRIRRRVAVGCAGVRPRTESQMQSCRLVDALNRVNAFSGHRTHAASPDEPFDGLKNPTMHGERWPALQ